jgi:MerR family transcriptional regulator, copper efflux regulator
MRIGKLAEMTGVSRDAIRLYEERGLIRSDRRANGYRDFPEGTEVLVAYIRTAQGLGFTLAEIGEEMPALTGGGLSQDEIAQILARKLDEIEARIVGLGALRDQLRAQMQLLCPMAVTLPGQASS